MAGSGSVVPVSPANQLPSLSKALTDLVAAGVVSRHGDFAIARSAPLPTPGEQAEARDALARYAALGPPHGAQVRQWLMTLNAAVGNAQGEAAFAMKLAALQVVLGAYRGAVFSQASLAEAMRRFDFFPSGAKLTELLDAEEQKLKSTEAALKRIAEWRPAAEKPATNLTPEEKLGITQRFRRMMAEVAEETTAQQSSTEAAFQDAKPVTRTLTDDLGLLWVLEKRSRDPNISIAQAAKNQMNQLQQKLGILPLGNLGKRT